MPYIGNVLTSFAVETGNINDQAVTAPKLSATGGTDGQVLALDSGGNLVWSSDPAGQWVTNGSDIYFDRASTNTNVATAGGIFVANTNTTANNVVALSFTAEPTDVAHPAAKIGAVFTDRTTDSEDTELYFSVVGAGTASEALRIDSSGRLLVGTSSETSGIRLVVQGNPSDATTHGVLAIKRGSANPTDDSPLGYLQFRDSASRNGAQIVGVCDGDWATNDYPGRLEFYTTADNASSPTEKMRISANGNLTVDTDTFFVDAVNDRVGVGTATPEVNLHVSDSSSTGRIRIQGGGTSSAQLQFLAGGETDPWVITNDSSRNLIFFDNASDRMRIDSAGRLLVGTNSDIAGIAASNIQGVHVSGAALSLGRNDTSVSEGNDLGRILFWGNDLNGTYEECASIHAVADGNHDTGDKPTRLVFSTTADGESSPTERLRITSNGALVLFNSPGISFSQIQGPPDAGTSTSEVLDAYEEGNWTPFLVGSSTNGSYGYDTDRTGGLYVRVGRLVHLQGAMRVTSTTTAATGSAFIGGVPFTPLSQVDSYNRTPAGILRVQPAGGSITLSDGAAFAFLEGTNRLGMGVQTTTGWSNIDVTDADDHQLIWFFSVSYETNDT